MDGMHYEGIIIRPPSEAESILLQVTVGCSHNKCTFCGTYKGVRFRIREDSVIDRDIRHAAQNFPFLKRVFITDGDALILPQSRLIRVLSAIREQMPWVLRVGLYGNAKSVLRKTPEELAQLRELGLGIVYMGLESGDDQVLEEVRKGLPPQRIIEAGQRVRQSGLKLSVTAILGLGGRQRSLEHARATGEALTAMDPNYVGLLTLMVLPNTELARRIEKGGFQLLDTREILQELREMLFYTQMTRGLFFANHASNYLPLRVRMPGEKSKALATIDAALRGRVSLRPEWMRGL